MTNEEEAPRTVHLDPSQLPGGARFSAPHIPPGKPDQDAAAEPVEQPSKPSAATVVAVRPAPEILAAARKVTAAPTAGEPAATLEARTHPASAPHAPSAPSAPQYPAPSAPQYPAPGAPHSPPDPSATTEPLGPRPPVIRQARSDRTAVYTSTPRPTGNASIPTPPPAGPSQRVAGTATVSPPAAPAQPAPGQPAANRPGWTVEPGWSAYPQQPAPTPYPGAPVEPRGPDAAPGANATTGVAESSALAGADTPPAQPTNAKRTVLTVLLVLIVAALVGAAVAWFAGDAIGTLITKVTG